MALRILSEPSDPSRLVEDLRGAIEAAIEGAHVDVEATSPGHFEIRVVSAVFEGQSRVQQQQRVYAAIAPLMRGDAPPVHAIDRLQTLVP
jgi:acid stress-induced BolA-like protein IbaG/YrbA